MSRLSATFVLNYLTRVVPSLGHVGKKMKADRVAKGAAILVAIGGVFGGDAALAAPFRFSDTTLGPRPAPIPNAATPTDYRTSNGVVVRMRAATNNGLIFSRPGGPGLPPTVNAPSIGNLGYPLGGNADTLTYNIIQNTSNPNAFGTLGLRVQFFNAANKPVPVQNLRFRVIDIDKDGRDGDTTAAAQIRDWQDQVSAFALLNGTSITLFGDVPGPNPTTTANPILDPNGTVELLGANTQTLTIPGGLGLGIAGIPGNARNFRGRDDADEATAVTSRDLGVLLSSSTDVATADAPQREADNRTQEGSVGFNSGANLADEFVILYGDGTVFDTVTPSTATAPLPSVHGLGILGDFAYAPGIIGVRKRVTNVVNNGAEVTVSYEVAVTNLGEVELTNVVLEDNLIRNLVPATTTYTQSGGNLPVGLTVSNLQSADGLNVNPAYNGDATDQLLAAAGAGNTLGTTAATRTKTLTYNVRFTPNGSSQYDSQVVATGTISGTTATTQDRSNDGTVFDGNADNDPTAAPNGTNVVSDRLNFTTTPAAFSTSTGILVAAGAGAGADDDTVTSFIIPQATPQIGVTKQVVGQPVPVAGEPGAYDITYRQIVSNVSAASTSPDDLTNVRLSEDLNATFRVGTSTGALSATIVPTTGLPTSPATAPAGLPAGYVQSTVNPAFNGVGDQDLILPLGNSLLDRGNYSVVDFVVRIRPQPGIPLEGLTPFEGQVTAIATPAGNADPTATVRDLSDDVTGVTGVAQISPSDGSANTPLIPAGQPNAGLPESNPIPANDPQAATNENNRTPVSLAAPPAIALSKRVTNVVDNGNGTFDVTYRQLVQNIGPTTLTGVQISENLNTTFRVGAADGASAIQVLSTTPVTSAAALNVGGATVPAALFVPLTGGAFTGVGSGQNMLAGTNTLAPNQYGAVDFVVRVTPGNTAASYGIPPFDGTALATGAAQDGPTVSDPSEDAARFPKGTAGLPADSPEILDANNDGIANQGATTPGAPLENTPTPVLFPQIAVAKRISNISGTGTAADPFIVEYTIVTTNVGATTLRGVQTNETSLDQTFPNAQVPDANANYVPGSLAYVSGVTPPTLNAAFTAEDSVANQDLFGPNLVLEPNQSTTVRYRVRLVSPPNDITFNSQSTATGSGVAAPTALDVPQLAPRDLSDDGSTPDPNAGDGKRGRGPGEDDPTPLRFPIAPQIGLTKQVFGTPIDNNDGTFDVTFRYRVQNTGLVPLTGVSIADNLQAQFAGQGLNRTTNPPPVEQFGPIVSVTPRPTEGTGPAIVAGGSANRGLSDTPTDALGTVPGTLGLGESSVIDVVVRVRPGAANLTNTYDGAARAVGTSTGAIPTAVADVSDDGTFLNGVAQTPTPDTIKPPVGNPNDPNAQNATPVIFAQGAPPIALFKAITAVPGATFTQPLGIPGAPPTVLGVSNLNRNLSNGDQVVYTLYAVNTTSEPIANFEVCDALQSGQLFVSANNLPTGVTSRAFGPLTPPGPAPLGRTCTPTTGGVGGTVVFTIPSLPTGTTALPFTIRVNR